MDVGAGDRGLLYGSRQRFARESRNIVLCSFDTPLDFRNGPLDAVPGFSQPPFAVSKATRAGYGALVQQVGTRSHEDGADFEAEGEAPSEGGP